MKRALALAGKGRFTVWPNPRVGCVIVKSPSGLSGVPKIIGEGFHLRKGEPHAERNALASCTEDPQGSTLYVTLEPCCHTGATPPCTEAILQAGIKRVVAAIADPFPSVNGKGFDILRQHGIQTETGLLEDEAWYENRFFFHRHVKGVPWVILKTAMTLDGKSATSYGHSQWITGEEARSHVHTLRAEMTAILAGIGTVLTDDPLLTARPKGISQHELIPPVRVILDPMLRIGFDCKILRSLDFSPVWIFCSPLADTSKKAELENLGVNVIIAEGSRNCVNLDEVLCYLGNKNILGLLIEGGPTIHTAFLEANLVNEVFAYIAPILAGGKESPTFYMGQGVVTMNKAVRLERVERLFLGQDTLIHGIIKR